MSLRTQLLLTPTTMAMTSPTKKILLRTCQMAMKTEDSLVFSWEGRHIPFCFTFISDIHLGCLIFIFAIDFPRFTSILVVYLYVHDLHSEFASVSCVHFDAFGQFPFIRKNTSMAQPFFLCAIPSQMPQSRGFWL